MEKPAWIEINGVYLRYRYRQRSGPVYVLLHEMGGTLESWDDVIKNLPTDASILTYDQRGFGLSEKPTEAMVIEDHLSDLQSLLKVLKIDKPIILAGVAVGAGICIAFSARYPEHVTHLLALAPACGIASNLKSQALKSAQTIAQSGLREIGHALFEKAYPEILRADPIQVEQYRMKWLSNDPHSLGALYSMLASQNLDVDVSKLSDNALLVGGIYDPLRPPSEIQRLHNLSSKTKMALVSSGHFMQVNSPLFVAFLLQQSATNFKDIIQSIQAYISANEHQNPTKEFLL